MGLRFYKRIRIFRNLYLNISKSGISFSFGEMGKSLNVSTRGVSGSLGVPGTGLSYRKRIFSWKMQDQDERSIKKEKTIKGKNFE